MKRVVTTLACLLSLSHTPMALADAQLAADKNCLACHDISAKRMGPSFKDIAVRYNGQNAVDKLTAKVMKGGSGVWGSMPMPSNPQVSEVEARKLVGWILTQK